MEEATVTVVCARQQYFVKAWFLLVVVCVAIYFTFYFKFHVQKSTIIQGIAKRLRVCIGDTYLLKMC